MSASGACVDSANRAKEIAKRILFGQGLWQIDRTTIGVAHPMRGVTSVMCVPLRTSILQCNYNARTFDQCDPNDNRAVAMVILIQVFGEMLRRYWSYKSAERGEANETPIRVFLEACQSSDSPPVTGEFVDASIQRVLFYRLWIFKFTSDADRGAHPDKSPLDFGAILAQMMFHALADKKRPPARSGGGLRATNETDPAGTAGPVSWGGEDIGNVQTHEQWRACCSLSTWAVLADAAVGYENLLLPDNQRRWQTAPIARLGELEFILHPKNAFSPLTAFYRTYVDENGYETDARQLDIDNYFIDNEDGEFWTFPLQKNVLEVPHMKFSALNLSQSLLPATNMAQRPILHELSKLSSQLSDFEQQMGNARKTTRMWAPAQAAPRAIAGGGDSDNDDHMVAVDDLSHEMRELMNIAPENVVAEAPHREGAAGALAVRRAFDSLADKLNVQKHFLNSSDTDIQRSQIACVLRMSRNALAHQHRYLLSILTNPLDRLQYVSRMRMREINQIESIVERQCAYEALRNMMLQQYERECYDDSAEIGKFNQAILRWIHAKPTNLVRFFEVRQKTQIFDKEMSVFGNWMAHNMELLEQYMLFATQHRHMLLLFFGSLTAYIRETSMMRFNSLTIGDAGQSKSYSLNKLTQLMIPDTVDTFMRITKAALQTEDDRSGHITCFHEFRLGAFASDFHGTATEEEVQFKELMTSNESRIKVYVQMPDGRRTSADIVSKAGGCFNSATNDPHANVGDAFISRWHLNLVRAGGRDDRTIARMKLAQDMLDSQDKNAYDYLLHTFHRRQALHYLVESLIHVNALPPFSTFVTQHVYSRLDDYFARNNWPAPAVRTDERVTLLIRVFSIQRALLLLFDVPGSRFYQKPFALEQLMYMDKLLHDTEEVVYFVLGLLNESFVDPNENVIRLLLLRHVLATNKATPREGYRNDTDAAYGGVGVARNNNNTIAVSGDGSVPLSAFRMMGDSSSLSCFSVQLPGGGGNSNGGGSLPDTHSMARYAAECELPAYGMDYSVCVVKKRSVDELVTWFRGVWPHSIPVPSAATLKAGISRLMKTTVMTRDYAAPDKPGERPKRIEQSELKERKAIDYVPSVNSHTKRGYFEIAYCILESVDLVRGDDWAAQHDPVREFIEKDMMFSKTIPRKVVYGRPYRTYPNLFDTIRLAPNPNKQIIYANTLNVNALSKQMLFVGDNNTSTDHRSELCALLRQDLDSGSTEQHLRRCFDPYDAESVRNAHPVVFEDILKQRWIARQQSDVGNIDYPVDYAQQARENLERKEALIAQLANAAQEQLDGGGDDVAAAAGIAAAVQDTPEVAAWRAKRSRTLLDAIGDD